jgi:hypothetical protein
VGDASDADWGVHQRVAESWEQPGAEVGRVLHAVSTEGAAEETLGRALDVLRRIGLSEH